MLPRITTIKCRPGAAGDIRHYDVTIVQPDRRATIPVLARDGRAALEIAAAMFDGRAQNLPVLGRAA